MSNPSFEEISGTIVLSGDLYGRDPVVKAPEAPATTTPSKTSTLSKTSTAATPTEKTDNGSNTSSNSSSSPMPSTKPTDNDDTITTFSNPTSKTDENSNDDTRSSKGTQSSATSTYGSTETNTDNDDSSVSDSISNISDKDNSKTQSPMSESNSDNQDYGNIARDKVKIIGIAVPLSCVAICIVLAVLYKCWWVKRNDTGVNPYTMRMSQRHELLEISGTKDAAPSMNRLGSDRVLSWRESNAFSGNRHQEGFNY
ncbi:hypothetical protein IWW45_001229 [Coemansia sp. RSA 485]|nr:hypothetical protein IWW45_001229 [Coemansia sp. RSA 485]